MNLTSYEEKALEGEYGEALQIAYRILLSIGRLTNASRLIKVSSAHVSGVSYSTIGEHGQNFLENTSSKVKVSVPTTVNPAGIDPLTSFKFDISEDYVRNQIKIINAYRRLGVTESFTCTPYEGFYIPPKGSHVSWAESSASVYANSVLGLKTNRESALSSLASALTGKTPYSELHIDEFRKPTFSVNVKVDNLAGSLNYGLLGYFIGKMTRKITSIRGVKGINFSESKSLCAAIGTSGASGLFLIDKNSDSELNSEKVNFEDNDLKKIYDELNDGENGDAIVLGCPHLNLKEISEISNIIEGKKFNKKCFIFCSRKTYNKAKLQGYTKKIEHAGVHFICNTCAVFTPLISKLEVDTITTNSCKAAHYIKRVHKVKISLKDTFEILKEVS